MLYSLFSFRPLFGVSALRGFNALDIKCKVLEFADAMDFFSADKLSANDVLLLKEEFEIVADAEIYFIKSFGLRFESQELPLPRYTLELFY